MSATPFIQFWEEVYGEALMLCSAIAKIPDTCDCSRPSMHLEGHCPCCGGENTQKGSGTNCADILAQLNADLSLLCNDFLLISKPSESTPGLPVPVRRSMVMAEKELENMNKVVQAVNESVVGFRQTCDVQQLLKLKQLAASLRIDCKELDDRLVEIFQSKEEL